MFRFLLLFCLSFAPVFFYSQSNVFDDIKLDQNTSLKWSDIDHILQIYDFVILYVADESDSHEQKIDFIKNEFKLNDEIAFVWIVAERAEGGDEVRKILDEILTINSCFLISGYQSYLVGTTRFVESKKSSRNGTYLYKYLKNRCVVDKLSDFKSFFKSGEGYDAIQNYVENKEVLELYQKDLAVKNRGDNVNLITRTYLDSLNFSLRESLEKPVEFGASSSLVFWRPYERKFDDGVGMVSNSSMLSCIVSRKMVLGVNPTSSLKPTIDFGLGFAVERASTQILREKSRLGLLNGDERFPVLVSDDVRAKIKSQALLFPLEFGVVWRRKSENSHLSLFSAFGFWTMVRQLDVGNFTRKSSDLFILDSNSGLEIRDINILNQYNQSLNVNEVNQFSINAFFNWKLGLCYYSKYFSYSISYGWFKSIVHDGFASSFIPESGAQTKLFDESHNRGNALGFSISYNL